MARPDGGVGVAVVFMAAVVTLASACGTKDTGAKPAPGAASPTSGPGGDTGAPAELMGMKRGPGPTTPPKQPMDDWDNKGGHMPAQQQPVGPRPITSAR
jgi:hypothetical protein